MFDNMIKKGNATSVAVMNQLPTNSGAEILTQSPFHHASLAALPRNTTSLDSGVILQENKLLGHLVLRANVDDKQFKFAVKSVLGVDLPSVLKCARSDGILVCWVSPDEWLIICSGEAAFDLENKLRNKITGNFSITNVSGGQTMLLLSGKHARDVLMKSTPYDVSDHNFPVDKVVTSVFAKSQAVFCRRNETVWELIVRRSFADYICLWLQHVSEEYGLTVKND